MGRKTWDSIPVRFRPLKGRVNVVISRQAGVTAAAVADGGGVVHVADSLEAALDYLASGSGPRSAADPDIARAFVIGGAQIYAAALRRPEARRILLTRVLSDFECDPSFPLALGEHNTPQQQQQQQSESGEETAGGDRWARSDKHAFDAWAGEEVPEGILSENGTQYEFQMWERAGSP